MAKVDSVFDCPRCNGKGYIDVFRHIKGGICFLCGGEKTISTSTKYPRNVEMYVFYNRNWYHNKTGVNPDHTWIWEWQLTEYLAVNIEPHVTRTINIHNEDDRQKAKLLFAWARNNDARIHISDDFKDLEFGHMAPDLRPKLKNYETA